MSAVFDKAVFNPGCTDCPRIAANLSAVKKAHPDYHCRPVAPFGVTKPGLLIVGLGPGMHGANATGRPFTGDYAGILLYETLYAFGFSKPSDPTIPPKEEIRTCNHYLGSELAGIPGKLVILALGRIAHDAVLAALQLKRSRFTFAHQAVHRLDDRRSLVDSYHCSRYNTQTRRLTAPMFNDVFTTAVKLINANR